MVSHHSQCWLSGFGVRGPQAKTPKGILQHGRQLCPIGGHNCRYRCPRPTRGSAFFTQETSMHPNPMYAHINMFI